MLLGHLDSIVCLNLLYLLNWEFFKYPYRLQKSPFELCHFKKGLWLSTSDGDRVYTKSNFELPRYNKKKWVYLGSILPKIWGEKWRKTLLDLPLKTPTLSSEPKKYFGFISAPPSVRSLLSTSRFQTNS